jgi:hypothetical protein
VKRNGMQHKDAEQAGVVTLQAGVVTLQAGVVTSQAGVVTL